jgi:CDP-L-myo-inositol myo-inositolphosphotransferase
MNSKKDVRAISGTSDTACVIFENADQANNIAAGLPVAARMVRELSEAGFAETWLVFPATGRLTRYAWEEVRRLGGAMTVRVSAAAPPDGTTVTIFGEGLIPAKALREGRLQDVAIRFDEPSAGWRILKATGKSGDGPVSRWLNRPISRSVSAVLLWLLPATRPIYVTWFNALIALAMFLSLAFGGPGGLVAGALLFHAASVLDGVDGEIARAAFRSSPSGAALDSAIDMATNLMFFVGVCINLWLAGDIWHAVLGAWGVFLVVIGTLIMARRGGDKPLTFDHVKHDYRDRFASPMVRRAIRLGTILTSRDFFALLGVVVVLAGIPKAIPYILATLATIWIPFALDLPNRVIGWMGIKREIPMN